ncbi:MAG: EAL domain-containing protein [Pseudomonadota bacterium]|nr:EAL domain-containing protein [Pseudomonadota bacterium]
MYRVENSPSESMEHGNPFSATDGPRVDFDAVCQKVRAAVEPARAHAVSLHDARGEVLWLSESSMGPDEHNAVREAVETFSTPGAAPVLIYDLGDSRSAVLLRTVNVRGMMVGAVMIVMDARVIKPDARGALKVMTPKLQRALADFAEMCPDSEAKTAPIAPAAVAGRAAASSAVSPQMDRLHAALRRSPIALHVQQLVPLTKGSQLKRYEVLLRSKSGSGPNSAPQAMLKAAVENGLGSMIDRRVITELIGWLVRHPDVWKSTAVLFSVNLTVTALHDEHFLKFVGLCLEKSSLPKGMIAFEVDTPTAVKLAAKMSEVAAALQRLGCPLVLDDFALTTECFALLRLPGVRYVKLAPEITAKMRTDKLSQAAITAVVQMARVLGMHTVAKRTDSAAEQEWLTALGVDFIQSNSKSPPVAIETLSKVSSGQPPGLPAEPPHDGFQPLQPPPRALIK